MALGKDYAGQDCALARALELVGERWTLLVVRDVFYGVRRFSDFQAHLDIPRAVLTARLSALVDGGVLERRRYQDSPPRDEYVLTEAGVALWPAVYALAQWAVAFLPTAAGAIREFAHVTCDAVVDPAGLCAVCGRVPPATELETRPGPGMATYHRDDPVSVALRRPHRLIEPLQPALAEARA
ncbi:winged helix-turn-helix transcriptional regulator [Yinghuangia seranimata]|uniref:winged helix-turn-helix transcriptional regulator n=1 Tax=Yinghuangia seranimata TaxID=408067 RepID=UPI00248AE2B9|nr:helix-turn-helix domain-containing protein [Yinghuangia seranimata]MDI2128660.1 helix-turn-helix domain-containing protein [Yinghuangia seranimata]